MPVIEDLSAELASLDAKIANIDRRLLLDPIFESGEVKERIDAIDVFFDDVFSSFFEDIRVGEGRVTSGMIGAQAITAYNMIDGAVTAAILAAGAVGTEHIQAAAIGAAQIQIASIDTAAIRNAAIIRALIAEAAIGTAEIDNLAVTNAKIFSIAASKITAGTITATVSLTAANILGGTIQIGDSDPGPGLTPAPYFSVNSDGFMTARQATIEGVRFFTRANRFDLDVAYGVSTSAYGIQFPAGDHTHGYVAGGSRIDPARPFCGRFSVGSPASANYLMFDDVGIHSGAEGFPGGTLNLNRFGGVVQVGADDEAGDQAMWVFCNRPNTSGIRVYNRSALGANEPNGIDIFLGPVGAGGNPDTGDRFLRFFRGDGTQLDSIQGDNAGGVRFTGTAAGTYSDANLKTNLRPLEAGELFDLVQWRTFDWDYPGFENVGERGHGPTAQSLMLAHPDLAAMVSHPQNPGGYMRVDKAELVPVLAGKILALEARIADLEAAAP